MRTEYEGRLLHLESMFMGSIPDTLNSLYTVFYCSFMTRIMN